MTHARFTAWTLLVGAGFALFAGGAGAQDPTPPKKDSAAPAAVTGYKNIERGGIPKDDLKAARENFTKFAKYYADVVAYTPMYRGPQEFKAERADNPYTIEGPNGLFVDLNRFLIVPIPGNGQKYGPDQVVYMHELGAALDAALKALITDAKYETIVRVNAARVLAYVCRGGAPAHFDTLTSLLSNANTRTEIKYHLFHAAANLLAAYDPNWVKTRNHVTQTDNPKPVGALVKVLDDCVNNPALLLAGLPDNKADKATQDQLDVIGLVRRQAIKALAQVRFAVIAGPDGKLLYPAHTLARVALGDPALLPAPGPADCAVAALGLMNMAPVEVKGDRVTPVKYNADAAVEAVTAALLTFAEPRAANAGDRSLPWRTYSIRLAEGMRSWRLLFDPDYDFAAPNKTAASTIPPVVEELYKDVVPKVLAPMDKVDFSGKPDAGATVAIESLRSRLTAIRANPNRSTTLFPGVPQTSIVFEQPAKKE